MKLCNNIKSLTSGSCMQQDVKVSPYKKRTKIQKRVSTCGFVFFLIAFFKSCKEGLTSRVKGTFKRKPDLILQEETRPA